MYTVHGVVLQFLQMEPADPDPADGFWWTILVAYLAPSYKEETEAPRQEVDQLKQLASQLRPYGKRAFL